jgi:hypothetical protein
MQSEHRHGAAVAARSQKTYIRLSQAMAEFNAYRGAKFAKTTTSNEMHILNRFMAFIGEDIQMRHLRPEHVTDRFYGQAGIMTFHTTRDGVGRPPVQASTHNHYVTRLKAFFEFCTKRGYVRTDLLADVDRMEEPKKRRQQPGPALLLQLLDHAEHARDRAYLAVALNSASGRTRSPGSSWVMLTSTAGGSTSGSPSPRSKPRCRSRRISIKKCVAG